MSQAMQPRRWTEEEFFAWLERQETKYELVDGQPVPRRAPDPVTGMVGATQRHDRVAVNLLVALAGRLRGSPCRPGTSDTAIRIPGRNIRYPDVAVDCGRFQDAERAATEPVLVAEVLSPSTRDFDQTEKLEEYRTVPTLRHILVIDPMQPRLLLHTRGAEGHWSAERIAGPDAVAALPALGIELPLAELYEGLSFAPLPRVVDG